MCPQFPNRVCRQVADDEPRHGEQWFFDCAAACSHSSWHLRHTDRRSLDAVYRGPARCGGPQQPRMGPWNPLWVGRSRVTGRMGGKVIPRGCELGCLASLANRQHLSVPRRQHSLMQVSRRSRHRLTVCPITFWPMSYLHCSMKTWAGSCRWIRSRLRARRRCSVPSHIR